jgi:hypothetical protein
MCETCAILSATMFDKNMNASNFSIADHHPFHTEMSSVQLHHHDFPVTIKPLGTGVDISLVDYLAKKCPSLIGPNAYFRPTMYLPNGHLQTFWAAYYNATETHNKIEYER